MIDKNNANEAIIDWGSKTLSSQGYSLKNNLGEVIQDTPWSYVVRFATSDGSIYLKHTPALLALEADISIVLRDQFRAPVPELIAHNAELNCFLMKDAGQPLRKILKKQFNAALFCKAIDAFTSMQLAVADNLTIFIDKGVPDWRLDKLPNLYKQLLSKEDILIEEGLTEVEIKELTMQLPVVADLCEILFGYSIKQSIVQPDFNDNNVLINESSQQITLIDLGEIVISHPFFSLVNCLRQVKLHHELTDNDAFYLEIRDACFYNFRIFESEDNLEAAFEIASLLWFVYDALAQYRLRLACNKTKFTSFQTHGKLRYGLREFSRAVKSLQ